MLLFIQITPKTLNFDAQIIRCVYHGRQVQTAFYYSFTVTYTVNLCPNLS